MNPLTQLSTVQPWHYRREIFVGLLAALFLFAWTDPARADLTDTTDLGIRLAASPKFPKALDADKPYPVRFIATNKGSAISGNAAITISLPVGASATGLVSGCSLDANQIKCSADFSKNKQFNATFTLLASDAAIGIAQLVANIGSNITDSQPADNTVTIDLRIGSVFDVKVSTSGIGNGTVTGSNGLDCGANCQVTVKSKKSAGAQVTLRAVPEFRKKLLKWTGVSCKANFPPVCKFTGKSGKTYTIDAAFADAPDEKVVLLLHGMNSSPATWKDYVKKNFTDCNTVDNGFIVNKVTRKSGVNCYAVRFGGYDDQGEIGLENAKQWATDNKVTKAGDFSNFDQLGKEIDKAIGSIKLYHPGAHVLLIGHSRGGLAARAFLSNQSAPAPLNSLWTAYVDGLITTGSPHQGTPIGKIYTWLKNHPRSSCDAFDDCWYDWLAVDELGLLLETLDSGLDARRPVISYLASGSPQLAKLNSSVLPVIATGQIRYGGVPLGVLNDLYDVFPKNRNGGKTTLLSKKLSTPAVDFVLGKGVNADQTNLLGDGIVPLSNQKYAEAIVDKTYVTGKVLHTDEPKKVSDINAMICKLNSPDLPTVSFKNWIKCP